MIARGFIGVTIPIVNNKLDNELLDGIHMQAKELGYDVVVFTNATNPEKSQPHTDYIEGEENIYRLAEQVHLSGLLIAAGRFQDEDIAMRIVERIKPLGIPYVVLEGKPDGTERLYPPQKDGIQKMTAHLIQAHGCRRIYCLTGPEDSFEAQERLRGFYSAIELYGLDKTQCRVFYGDFWKESARRLAGQIVRGEIPMPEAIVCAGDIMALTLCEEFKSCGIHVPEQIKITGYDGSFEAMMNEPILTTVCGRDYVLGREAVSALYEKMTGARQTEDFRLEISVKYGTSCGCPSHVATQYYHMSKAEFMERDFLSNCTLRELYMTSNFIGRMSGAETEEEFGDILDNLAYLPLNWEKLDFCICEDWKGNFESPDICRAEGYSENMIHLLDKLFYGGRTLGGTFPTKDFLPGLQKKHTPVFCVALPIHFGNCALGYCVFTYNDAKKFVMDERIHNWCNAASNGLQSLKNKLYIDYMRQKMERYATRDLISGMYNRKGLFEKLPEFFKSAEVSSAAVLLLTITWGQTIISNADAVQDSGIVIANLIQMAEKRGELAARISEKVFVILIQFPPKNQPAAIADQKILQLIQMLKSLQERTSVCMPELRTEHVLLSDVNSVPEILDEQVQQILRTSKNAQRTDFAPHLQRIHLELWMMPGATWRSETAAAELGISKSYFQRLYKQHIGTAFTDDLIAARLSKAKSLLETTNLRIQEISEQCGYQTMSHFMRQFKERTGVTAIQFRRGDIAQKDGKVNP